MKINAISALSNLIAELSLRTTWHVARHVARDQHRIAPRPLERTWCCEEIRLKKKKKKKNLDLRLFQHTFIEDGGDIKFERVDQT